MTAPDRATFSETNAKDCYHCGLPVPPRVEYQVVIGGRPRVMCCAGCEAVASAIVAAGLDDYYTRRDNYPQSQREALPQIVSKLEVFDRPEIQDRFVTQPAAHEREASLILEGITCPGCVWLNETHLMRQTGVVAVNVNYTTNRATVRWDTRRTSLSQILATINAIGYRAYPYDAQSLEASRKREARSLLARFAIAGLGMMQVMMYALPRYLAEGGIDQSLYSLMNWAALILTAPVVFYSSLPFMSGAWRDIRNCRIGMDVPVAAAIIIAFTASVLATVTGEGEVYFDSVAMFVFFLLGARYLELRARQKAASHLESLSHAMPATAHKLAGFPQSDETDVVPAGALTVGDRVLVRPGEAIPADGIIEQGDSEIDESLLTGESMPVKKVQGQSVAGGSINRGNPLVVRVQRVGDQTVLSAIVKLMERASASRPRLQQITDRVAARFVSVILVLAAATAIWWLDQDAARTLPIVVSVLIVTCPCALALATPMAMAVATSSAAKRGLLVTRSHALETLARATHFVIDKTGTLTLGKPSVQAVYPLNADRENVLLLAAALEQGSEHPVATAMREAARSALHAEQVRNVPGYGVEGVVAGRKFRIGTEAFAAELAANADTGEIEAQIWLADEEGMLAGFDLQDQLRPDAAGFVAALRAQGGQISLLSGDRQSVVRDTAVQLGIETWRATMSPEQKLDYVKALQAQGAVVAMIGDGVNDAPVLTQAQVAIALVSGAALAQGAADMVLLTGRLSDLTRSIEYSRRTLRIVRQNLGWAIAYNVLAIPLAMTGYITPWMAAIGMSGSSLLVVGNAARLAGERRAHRVVLVSD
ncbi:MAG: cadmium-translocating P-type ATPase [Betaproteobacteria bacterium]|jgi:Cu2+-exporting ATPase|nr:MAG: cadmium-translocating P-type ATPase [Betaproteobacteria bacterium]